MENLRNVALIYFWVQCEPNMHKFSYLGVSPDAYGEILATTADQKHMMLAPVFNDTWQEIEEFHNRLSAEVQLCPSRKDEFFDRLLLETLDELRTGEPWYLWGHIPCPICGSRVRANFGPELPIRGEYRDVEFAKQERWTSLSATEREKQARAVLSEFRSDWYYVIKN